MEQQQRGEDPKSKGQKWTRGLLLILILAYEIVATTTRLIRPLPISEFTILIIVFFLATEDFYPFLERLKKFSISQKGIEVDLDAIKQTQKLQHREIEALRFLVQGYVSVFEFEHLTALNGTEAVPFHRWEVFDRELRRLRDFGLIEIIPEGFQGLPVGLRTSADETDLPEDHPDLRTFYRLTAKGKEYLRNRTILDSSPQKSLTI